MAPNLNLQLPQELADAIIDTVRETSTSSAEAMKNLSSCSLVSRSFFPRTRLYIFADIPFLNAENVKRYHDICLASPIIPPAARTLAFQTFDLSAVESPLMASFLRLTTNVKDISFFKVSWDKLPEEVLDVISSYQKISRILFKDTVIPSIDSFFSFFRGCTIRSSFTLIISGSLHVGNAEEQVELTPLLTYDNKPIAIQSLTLECPDAARKALRAILLFPSSPFNLRHLVTASLAIIGIPPADTWIDANAAFQRDVISSSNPLEKARSHFVIQAVPSFPIRLPSTIQTLNIGLIDPPRHEGLDFWPSSLLRWWINTLLQSRCYDLKILAMVSSLLMSVCIVDDEALDEWSRLDEELSSSNYRLKAVVIGIGHQGWLDDDVRYTEVVNTLVRHMPGLARMEVLKVRCDVRPALHRVAGAA